MKTHLSFDALKFDESIRFYSTLLDTQPAKIRDGYALFITDEPGLELALQRSDERPATADGHYGIAVRNVDDVEHAIARLERAGLVRSVEREETCCYANQTKVWASDPDGRRWEIYTVHQDTEERIGDNVSCCD